MDKENLWEVCEHIHIGSTNEVWLMQGKMALCKRCAVELSVEFFPERLQTVYEDQLRDLIKDIDIIGGMEFLNTKE